MKVKKLIVHNLGIIEHEEILIDEPLIIFYGGIRQGKTTILNAVRWACGGAFPSDIIRHGQTEAHVELSYDNGCIRREWYVSAKDNTTKARDIMFIRDGRPVKAPVAEIAKLLNPFVLNQDYLRNMGESERRAYFVELFGADTKEFDEEAFRLDRLATTLRAKLKAYGVIDTTEPHVVDPAPLREKLRLIRQGHSAAVQQIGQANVDANARLASRTKRQERISEINERVAELERNMAGYKTEREGLVKWLDENPEIAFMERPADPDTAELEGQIEDAVRSQEQAKQYRANLDRQTQKDADAGELQATERRLKEIKAEKSAKLVKVSADSKIKDLKFDETGNFTYQGTQAGMLSTAQLMELSSALSGLYPEGLGLELLDRGESLGKSIFEFIKRAQAEEKTILATVVGEAPAEVPEKVGVFVVDQGKAKPHKKPAKQIEPAAQQGEALI